MATTYQGEQLPRFSGSDVRDPEAFVRKLNQFVTTLDERIGRLEGPLVNPREPATGEEVYTVSNVTELRTLDPTASGFDLTDLANVVGTFLEDLINEGKLR